MLGVDYDKIILLSTPFPTIPMLGTNCCCSVIVFYVGNKRCIVLHCIVLYLLFRVGGSLRDVQGTHQPTVTVRVSSLSPTISATSLSGAYSPQTSTVHFYQLHVNSN